jgi:hypothetical protein
MSAVTEHRMKYRNFYFKKSTVATESWWLNADRSSFLQAAREQQDRMAGGSMATFVSALPRTYGLPHKSTDASSVAEGRSLLAMAGHEASSDRVEESRPPSSVGVRW